MAKKRTDLKIPYGVSDFRTIRNVTYDTINDVQMVALKVECEQ